MTIVYIICGPTCSGKSQLAMKIAKSIGGALINADSVQIYDELQILSASPSLEDKTLVPHFLYNFLAASKKYNVADYVKDCERTIEICYQKNLLPIIVGGTGMYINALMEGISLMPVVSQATKDKIDEIISVKGLDYLYSLLEQCDPIMASKLEKNDKQRIARSYEIYLQTGKSILEFRAQKEKSIFSNYNVKTIYLKPERQFLYNSCNERFLKIIQHGALEEAMRFQEKYKNISHGVIKALGFKELMQYSKNEICLEEAVYKAQTSTRNYAKRQYTWFNNQISWPKTTLEYSNFLEYKTLFDNLSKIL
jgi:tRNA dimethylallyltransferase